MAGEPGLGSSGLRSPWAALPLVAVLAFAAGRCLGTGAEPPGEAVHAHPDGPDAASSAAFTCAMHPQVRQAGPGTCPICGMDLVPAGSGGSAGATRVTLGERARALARIRTSPVRTTLGGGAGALRLEGRVEADERQRKVLTAWTPGRIDRLHVDFTGQPVRRGQVVATLYSPEIYAAHQDLLTAAGHARRAAGDPTAGTALEAARRRLELLGVPAADLARMERADRPARQVPVRSPFAGTVTRRVATEGSYVTAGAALYELADLGRPWVQLDAYAADLGALTVGSAVTLRAASHPDTPRDGRVTFIDPIVDPRTGIARVRVEVAEEEPSLRPGVRVEALVHTSRSDASAGETGRLWVPSSAPLFTGRRSVVYVEVPGSSAPTYEMRVVRLGPKTSDGYPVVAGLTAGERVVTHGAFVLDADLQLRGGLGMMSVPDDGEIGPFDEAVGPIDPAFRADLATVVLAYLDLGEALAADDLPGALVAATTLSTARGSVSPPTPSPARTAWDRMATAFDRHLPELAAAADLVRARSLFEPLSGAVELLLRSFGNPTQEPLHLAFCPMAFDDTGATWVQRGTALRNAYFGADMLTCGSVRARIAPGETLPGPSSDPMSVGGRGLP